MSEARIAQAFANSGKRAALMPYLMAGFPTLSESARIGQACVQAGADLLELGVPYADPLADGPVIHAAGTRALQAGASMSGVLEVARTLAPSVPVVLMCYANMVFAPGVEAFVARLEGILPALETAHALAWVLAQSEGELDLICLSGRGDKDLAEVLASE